MGKRYQVVKKMSNIKKSNISTMEEVHTKNKFTQWCSHILMSILMSNIKVTKLVKNTFYLHFEGFWWSWYVMSKLMSISVNHIMSINFFVNLLHSLPVCFLDIWHLFDNLTSFDIFIAAYIIWGNVIISHLSVHLSTVGYLPYLGVPTLALGGTYLGKVPTLAWGTYVG